MTSNVYNNEFDGCSVEVIREIELARCEDNDIDVRYESLVREAA